MNKKNKLVFLILFLLTPSIFSLKDYLSTIFKLEDQGLMMEKSSWWKKPEALKNYFKGLVVSKDFMELRFARALGLDNSAIAQRYPFDESRYKAIKEIREKVARYDLQTVLVESEKGLGDIIQFARYVPNLKIYCKKVIFSVPNSLYTLFKESRYFEGITIMTPAMTEKNVVESYTKIPLLAIPFIIFSKYSSVTHLTLQNSCPYLIDRYKTSQSIKSDTSLKTNKLKVGICWQGSKNHINDKNRSVPLSLFYPLAQTPTIQLYSLQVGEGEEQLQNLPSDFNIFTLKDYLGNFLDTASVVENLDLIITVDSAMAHLIGALGKKVWVLIPSLPDFRWFIEGLGTPWYPSMTLYRQQIPGDWETVINKIVQDVQQETEKLQTI